MELMKIWFVHQNFPGQFKHLARFFAAREQYEVVTIGEARRDKIANSKHYTYKQPKSASADTHPYIRGLEAAVRRGQEAARLALQLKKDGLSPDIVYSHPGWGDTLYFKEIFPDAKFLSYFEFYYRSHGSDVGFDPEFSTHTLDDKCRIRTKNSINLLTLDLADWGVCPTQWQYSQFPEEFKSKISVVHDGIDTVAVRPNPQATVTLGRDRKTFTTQDEIITFCVRNLEPYRGFHIFMRALPELMRRRPSAHFLVVGGDEVSYGRPLPQDKTYRQHMTAEVGDRLDMNRIHFLGRLPYAQYINVLQLSSAHVYLTYPFVLSWSFLEAMAAGCLVIASQTPPVEEVLTNGSNGLLFDFFSPDALCDAVCQGLDNPERAIHLKQQARATIVEKYDLNSVCLPKQVALIEQIAQGIVPSDSS